MFINLLYRTPKCSHRSIITPASTSYYRTITRGRSRTHIGIRAGPGITCQLVTQPQASTVTRQHSQHSFNKTAGLEAQQWEHVFTEPLFTALSYFGIHGLNAVAGSELPSQTRLVLSSAKSHKAYRVPASKVLFYLPPTSVVLLRGRSLSGCGSVLRPGVSCYPSLVDEGIPWRMN